VEAARRQVAELLGCLPEEVFFTSGGTESNNHAIKGMARALREKGRHIVTSTVEHPAVLAVCRHLAGRVSRPPMSMWTKPVWSRGGCRSAIRPDTILISIMHANNEVGTIQPIAEIAELAKKRYLHAHRCGPERGQDRHRRSGAERGPALRGRA
jgi:cysteine desulfurase